MQSEHDHPKRKKETDGIHQRLACMMQERNSHRENKHQSQRMLGGTMIKSETYKCSGIGRREQKEAEKVGSEWKNAWRDPVN